MKKRSQFELWVVQEKKTVEESRTNDVKIRKSIIGKSTSNLSLNVDMLTLVYHTFKSFWTLFRLGRGVHCRFLICCAKTACSRVMKRSHLKYNYIGHNLKWFPVNSNQWCCHGNVSVKEHLAKIYLFPKKMEFFSLKSCLYRIFQFKFEISDLKLTFVLEFWPQTIAKTTWWRHTHVTLMMSSKFLMLLRDFVLDYHPSKPGGDWPTNKGEKGAMWPLQPNILPKYPSLNRVN